MPVAVADGALGIEAIHTWTPPQGIVSGGIPTFTLNDHAALSSLSSGDGYAVKVKNIAGLHSLPDLIDEREPALGRIGELVYDAEDSGKTVVYSGTIYGSTLQKLREGSNAMRRTFQAKSREAGTVHWLSQLGEGMMTIAPHASYGSEEHVFFGRAQSLEMGDEQTLPPTSVPSGFGRAFVLTIRLADPRVYASTMQESAGNLDGTSIFVTNDGSAPTDPSFKLTGAFTTTPLVIARGTDYVLSFENMNGISDSLWVDFKGRRAWLESNNMDMTAHLSVVNSNWWDPGVHGLDPGPNDIGVTGSRTTIRVQPR